MTPITLYRYPDDSNPEVKKVKRLASRAARLEGRIYKAAYDKKAERHAQYETSLVKLKTFMATLKWSSLFYWRGIILIDPRWCGASGTGAYIAVASRIVNQTAKAILKENPAPTFWVEEWNHQQFKVSLQPHNLKH